MGENQSFAINGLLINTNYFVMKKILFTALILASIIGMSSCDYDDSNDIDVLTPNDSTETGITEY